LLKNGLAVVVNAERVINFKLINLKNGKKYGFFEKMEKYF
jgi:hypothetical protein